MKRISVVVPAHNEEKSIPRLLEALHEVFSHLPYELELVVVDDTSTDTTLEVVKGLAHSDSRVKYLSFAQNAGQQAATSAGLTYASGDAVIIMDADLQHPPSIIPALIQKWEEGSMLVFGIRATHTHESFLRGLASGMANALINIRHHSGLPGNTADFSLIDRSVVDAFKKLPAREVMTRYRLAGLSTKRAYVPFPVTVRTEGESKYTYKKLLRLFWKSFVGKEIPGSLFTVAHTNIMDHA